MEISGRQHQRLRPFLPRPPHRPDWSQILPISISRHGGEIKIAHFLSPHKEQINFRRPGDVMFFLFCFFPATGLSRLRRSYPDWLPAGGPSLTARLAGAQLLLPPRVYLRLAMRIAIIYPSQHLPKQRKRGERGERRNWFFLIHAAARGTLGTPRLSAYFQKWSE